MAPPNVGENPSVPAAGIPYFLPFTQYKIKVTHRLTDCWDDKDNPTLAITTKANAIASEAPDPQRTYVIDAEKLRSFFKATDLTVEYHGPMQIKSINATVEDKTGPFVASVFTSLAKVSVVALGAGGAKTNDGRKGDGGCNSATAIDLRDIKLKEKLLEDKKNEIEATTKDLNELTEMAKIMGKVFPPSERIRHGQLYRKLKAQQSSFAIQTNDFDKLLKKLTITDGAVWPENGEIFETKEAIIKGITAQALNKWGDAEKWGKTEKFENETAVWAKIESTNPISRKVPCVLTSASQCKDDAFTGFKYRMSVPGVLTLFVKKIESIENTQKPGEFMDKPIEAEIGKDEGSINQLGSIFTLPLKSTIFSNKSIVAEFDKAGVVTKLGVKSSAASDVAATTIASMVEQAIKIKDAKDNEEINKIKNNTALNKAKKEDQDALKALDPDKYADAKTETETFATDTKLKEAKIANIEATEALKAASQ